MRLQRFSCRYLRLAVCLGVCAGLAIACKGTQPEPTERKRTVVLSTEFHDERAGTEASKEVQEQIGLVNSPELVKYVQGIGKRLVRYAPRRSFDYHFSVVNQFEPNAFALPGGYVYLTRGLLALINSEDELANVLGHEIAHSANRHAAAQQEFARRQNPFTLPWVRMSNLASYGRDQERAADQGGQTMAAKAGYDPAGMVTFLSRLGGVERLVSGISRVPSLASTHPGTIERVADCAARARAIPWRRDPSVETGLAAYLARVEGIALGVNPAEGVFEGDRFLHPDLDFHIQFPHGWRPQNSHVAVGAISPRGDAVIFLKGHGVARDAKLAAEEFVQAHEKEYGLRVTRAQHVQLRAANAYRVGVEAVLGGQSLAAEMTFIPYKGSMYRVTGVAPARVADQFLGRARNTVRSFRPLTPDERNSIRQLSLRVVKALPDEDLVALGLRTGNGWGPQRTAVLNGISSNTRFQGGELLKIAHSEPYRPSGDPAFQLSEEIAQIRQP
ncbi:MAG: M48 family metalloprotease [Myxococcota bacterium]